MGAVDMIALEKANELLVSMAACTPYYTEFDGKNCGKADGVAVGLRAADVVEVCYAIGR